MSRVQGGLVARISPKASRQLSHLEDRTVLRSAEIQGIAYIGQTALRGVAEVSICEEELAKLCPPGTRIRMAAISDAVTAAVQVRVLDLMEGL